MSADSIALLTIKVTISDDGSWNKHIELVIDKAYSRLNILRMLKFRLDRLSLEKLYLSFIRPLLEYGDVVWDPHNMYFLRMLRDGQSFISGGREFHNFKVDGRK
jgi:hypothetical protein